MIRRCSFLSDQPSSTNRAASQSSSAGMRRRFGQHAEVVGRAHDPVAEMPLPDPIDDHARGQRVVLRRDPARQLAPAASAGDRWLLAPAKNAGRRRGTTGPSRV